MTIYVIIEHKEPLLVGVTSYNMLRSNFGFLKTANFGRIKKHVHYVPLLVKINFNFTLRPLLNLC